MGSREPHYIETTITISGEFRPFQVILSNHMFFSMKMEEYMESEFPGIFRVELIPKIIVLGSLGTHFRHMRFK